MTEQLDERASPAGRGPARALVDAERQGHRDREPARRPRARDPDRAAAELPHQHARRPGGRARRDRGHLGRPRRRRPARRRRARRRPRAPPHRRRRRLRDDRRALESASASRRSAWQVGVLRAGAWTARGLRVPARNALLADVVPPSRLRPRVRIRARDGQPRRHRRAAARARARRAARRARGDPALDHPGPARRRGDRLRDPPRTTAGTPRATADPAAAAAGDARPARAADARRRRLRVRQHRRHAADPARHRAVPTGPQHHVCHATRAGPVHRVQPRRHARERARRPCRRPPWDHARPRRWRRAVPARLRRLRRDRRQLRAAWASASSPPAWRIGCAETAEHAAVAHLAPEGIRGSAFGLLAAIQSVGNLAASAIAGALWTLVSPAAAFIYAAAWMALAFIGLLLVDRGERETAGAQ